MGGVFDNVRRKVYPEVEIDDDFSCGGGGFSLDLGVAMIIPAVMVGVEDAGSVFLVGADYVEMVRWRSR